ncbi:hypothetical protein M409DRAFT_54232 [Zasmidium cellare ATCC 36951]|uniref:Uncharacterized protein n=1 Tax=Zasmidium cellare ATCC 36951 TaxID=1080233 RepID=A0A6A6CIN5_ZASCE|nr:uncharacterized protein M409DRAFT_54232 [Zasmidium cellare ATCC 36951]KAF2167015.1 hypothetical protein M409DRAFT_54232 [Zasmidium cellare ATCC 36951]
MGKKWDRFQHLDENEYWNEICAMSENQLRAEHKIIQQNVISASAGASASGAAGFFTFGLAWGITAINARRINVNSRQCDLIERRLREQGWDGHSVRKRDFFLGAGPCVAAELIIPAGGALLGQAVHHATTSAAGHAAAMGAQHAAQAAGQHVAQVATEQAAQNIATHVPLDALTSVANHTSTFFHSALQGVGSEVFTASHGAIGHASAQYFSSLPGDLATAQAKVLGAAAGQAAATEATREALSKATFYSTERAIKNAIDSKDKNNSIVITTTEISSDIDLEETQKRAAKHLLSKYYQSMLIFERDGTTKTDIDRVDTCTQDGCDCTDYDDRKQSQAAVAEGNPYYCLCGHAWGYHERKGENGHIIAGFCKTWYKRFEHRENNGCKKEDMADIEPCEDCGCRDYDLAPGQGGSNCRCGHSWGTHSSALTSEEINEAWILGVVSASYVKYLADA